MFLAKKIVSAFFLPASFSLGILLMGLVMLWFTRRQRAAKFIVSAAALLLVVFSYGATADTFLRRLEWQYSPLDVKVLVESTPPKLLSSIRWIVVLGAGHFDDPHLPATSQLTRPSLARLIEGVRIHEEFPGRKLIVSGGPVFDKSSDAEVMMQAAMSLGVRQEDVVLETESKDTEDEARVIQSMVNGDQFILVTSAAHMPRSMALFKKRGMNPIPSPADFWVSRDFLGDYGSFFPNASALEKSETAAHEVLGLLWAKLRGKI
jgi:uncharacterized SAM-binding protein YcdF (DUF218 family)